MTNQLNAPTVEFREVKIEHGATQWVAVLSGIVVARAWSKEGLKAKVLTIVRNHKFSF